MHQTTVRFGRELWEALTVASDEVGISVAQYVREAAIESLAGRAARDATVTEAGHLRARLDRARAASAEVIEAATALDAQGALARAKAGRLKAKAERERKSRKT